MWNNCDDDDDDESCLCGVSRISSSSSSYPNHQKSCSCCCVVVVVGIAEIRRRHIQQGVSSSGDEYSLAVQHNDGSAQELKRAGMPPFFFFFAITLREHVSCGGNYVISDDLWRREGGYQLFFFKFFPDRELYTRVEREREREMVASRRLTRVKNRRLLFTHYNNDDDGPQGPLLKFVL